MRSVVRLLSCVICLLSSGVCAQQMIQSGKPLPGRAGKWITNLTMGDAGPANGGPAGTGLTELNITSTLNNGMPFCINDAPITGPYHQLCMGTGGGQYTISANAFGGATPQGLVLNINGTNYGFPASGAGTGNVVGPSTAAINEITSWANTTGTLLRQGVAQITDSKTAAITATGATLTGFTNNTTSADQILAWDFCTGPCLPLPAAGGGNYDAVRGVGILTVGSSLPLVNGIAGYVDVEQAVSGTTPSSVAVFGTGVIGVAGGAVWGSNFTVSDNHYRVAGTATGRQVTAQELDVSISNPATAGTALIIGGNSVVQPNNITAVSVQTPDFNNYGAIAKWSQAYYVADGATKTAMLIGASCNSHQPAWPTCDSQGIEFGSYLSGSGNVNQLAFGNSLALSPANNTAVAGAFVFSNTIIANSGGMIARSTANQIVQLSGKVTLAGGSSISSRNDPVSPVVGQPLEIIASQLLLNAPLAVLVGGTVTPGLTCAGVPSAAFASTDGIVTHC